MIPFVNGKLYFRGSVQLSIITLSKFHPSGNLKFNYLGVVQSLNLRILMKKLFLVSLELSFTPKTLGCYGMMEKNPSNIAQAKVHSKYFGVSCVKLRLRHTSKLPPIK